MEIFLDFRDMEKILLYPARNNELEDFVHIRAFKTEDEAWDFIIKKKAQPKFRQYDIINEGED